MILGIVAVWLYAALASQCGGKARTAVHAGAMVWLIGVLLPIVSYGPSMGFFAGHLALLSSLGGLGLIGLVAGTAAGVALSRQ